MISFNNNFEIQKKPASSEGGVSTDSKDSIGGSVTDSIEITDVEEE